MEREGNMFGFGGIDIFFVLFFIVFALMLGVFVYSIVKSIANNRKNHASPILDVSAKWFASAVPIPEILPILMPITRCTLPVGLLDTG